MLKFSTLVHPNRLYIYLCEHIAFHMSKETRIQTRSENLALFGKAPAPAPKSAPAGALPNGLKWSSSSHGAAPGAPSGFHWGGGATKTWLQAAPTILHPNSTGEAVLPNVSQNSSSSTREAAPPEKPELFLKEPELCQTGPNRVCVAISS